MVSRANLWLQCGTLNNEHFYKQAPSAAISLYQMNNSLNSFKGGYIGDYHRASQGDTRSLDYSSDDNGTALKVHQRGMLQEKLCPCAHLKAFESCTCGPRRPVTAGNPQNSKPLARNHFVHSLHLILVGGVFNESD